MTKWKKERRGGREEEQFQKSTMHSTVSKEQCGGKKQESDAFYQYTNKVVERSRYVIRFPIRRPQWVKKNRGKWRAIKP
jgi:hypothetical protein